MTLAQSMLGFGLLATVMAITPGLDTIFVLRQALRGHRGVAFAAGAGVCLGTLTWGVAAAAGVAALFVASQLAFTALRWGGVVFLAWMGLGYLRQAWRGQASVMDEGAQGGAATMPLSARRAFLQGLATNLLNPKVAVFYLTVLPLFLPVEVPAPVAGALLAGVHATVGMAWFVIVIFAAGAVRGFLNSRTGARAVDASAGLAMLGFGVALGLER